MQANLMILLLLMIRFGLLFQALLIIIGPTDESQPYVSSTAASQALKQAGVAQYVLNLGDYIDSRESKDITYNSKRIYYSPYNTLSGIAPRVAGDLQRGIVECLLSMKCIKYIATVYDLVCLCFIHCFSLI